MKPIAWLVMVIGTVASAEVEPTYSSIFQKIIRPKCLHCHDVDSGTGVVLSSYQLMMDSEVISPGSPEDSSLFEAVETGDMPRKAKPLAQQEVDAIKEWITQGAKP